MKLEKLLNGFRPDLCRDSLLEVTPADLAALGVKAVAVDADNTSSFDGTTRPLPGATEWIRKTMDAGYPVILVSNAAVERAETLAAQHGIPVVPLARKPFPDGCRKAAEKLGISTDELVMIGDQLQTDILGANWAGCRSIFVKPYEREHRLYLYFFVKRTLDRILLRLMNLDR